MSSTSKEGHGIRRYPPCSSSCRYRHDPLGQCRPCDSHQGRLNALPSHDSIEVLMPLVILMVFLASGRCCDLLVHPVDDLPFVPDDRTRTQLNLLGEGSVAYAGRDEGLPHTRHLNDLRQ